MFTVVRNSIATTAATAMLTPPPSHIMFRLLRCEAASAAEVDTRPPPLLLAILAPPEIPVIEKKEWKHSNSLVWMIGPAGKVRYLRRGSCIY
jgi:hypothetical protein